MENGMARNDLLRMVGVMAIFVGIAWAIQIFGFSHGPVALARLMWVVAAAAICGAGAGLVLTAGTMRETEQLRA